MLHGCVEWVLVTAKLRLALSVHGGISVASKEIFDLFRLLRCFLSFTFTLKPLVFVADSLLLRFLRQPPPFPLFFGSANLLCTSSFCLTLLFYLALPACLFFQLTL